MQMVLGRVLSAFIHGVTNPLRRPVLLTHSDRSKLWPWLGGSARSRLTVPLVLF